MAKKKRGRKPRTKSAPPPKGSFMSGTFMKVTGAFMMILLAFLILLGNFGIGGTLPVWLGLTAAQGLFGGAGYIVPAALIYWGVRKFQHEEKKLPFTNFLSMSAVPACGLTFGVLPRPPCPPSSPRTPTARRRAAHACHRR